MIFVITARYSFPGYVSESIHDSSIFRCDDLCFSMYQGFQENEIESRKFHKMSNGSLIVSFDAISDYFNCPVCMCELDNPYITPCGHRYCEGCIRECVDRHHKCPCCNTSVRTKDLIKDHQYDELHCIIKSEKSKSEENYFSTLISGEAQPGEGSTSQEQPKKIFSPIEEILKKHLKDSLFAHEHYYQDLQTEKKRRKERLKSDLDKEKEELFDMGLSACDIQPRVDALQKKYEASNKALDEQLQKNMDAVAEAYDRHLTEHIPQLSILPVKVKVVLLEKNITFSDINMNPKDSLENIRGIIKEQLALKGDKLVEFDTDVKYFAFGPFLKLSAHEMYLMARDIIDHGTNHPNIHALTETCLPVIKFGLKTGSVIAVYGHLTCESDMPKECFATTFRKGHGSIMDYFSCEECSLNWICRPCMESCHQTHPVKPYIMNHQPTWACCYCPKKKKCTITNSEKARPTSVC